MSLTENDEFEITSDIDVYTSFGVKSLMSERYKDGQATLASNITCQIKPKSSSVEEKNMIVTVYELAPFSSNANYCLRIGSQEEPVMCSGSRTFLKECGSYKSSSGWAFSLTLNQLAEQVPKIKLWITITSENLILFQHILYFMMNDTLYFLQ